VIGTDSGLLDQPYPMQSLLLSPGERVDLLVKAATTKKSYRFLSLPYSRMGMSSLQQVTLLTLNVGGRQTNDALPGAINPAATRPVVNPMHLVRRSLALSMMQGHGYINNIAYTDMMNAYTMTSDMVGTAMHPVYEIWDIYNDSGMDHPFHQHVNAGQVLAISGGDAAYASFLTTKPVWKDTVIIPKWGSVSLLIPVLDWSGMTMFHCHIMEHEDIGMMGVWNIGNTMPM
jgi:FtsP/CotA-like multicopper oxidase with cupredoxin domain